MWYASLQSCNSFAHRCFIVTTCNHMTCVHGTCNGNECSCTDVQWTGPFCNQVSLKQINKESSSSSQIDIIIYHVGSQAIQPVVIAITNNTVPSVALNASSEFQYDLNVVSIAEQRRKPIILASVPFAIVQHTTDYATTTNYSALLENGTSFHATMYLFQKAVNISFAGSTATYRPNTIKLAIHVENWPFTSLSNSLHITIGVQTPIEDVACTQFQDGTEAGQFAVAHVACEKLHPVWPDAKCRSP